MSPALAGGFFITGSPRKSDLKVWVPESILVIVNFCWRTFNISHIMHHFILGQLCCFIKCCPLFLMHASPLTSAILATRTQETLSMRKLSVTHFFIPSISTLCLHVQVVWNPGTLKMLWTLYIPRLHTNNSFIPRSRSLVLNSDVLVSNYSSEVRKELDKKGVENSTLHLRILWVTCFFLKAPHHLPG